MKICTLFLVFLLTFSCTNRSETGYIEIRTDVCIYGATPAGIASAISAAKSGYKVALIEPTGQIGGLVTSGLSHTDFHSFESLTGAFLDFSQRVEQYYIEKYGEDSEQVNLSFQGTFGEPKVNLLVFQSMISEYPQITIHRKTVLEKIDKSGSELTGAFFKTSHGKISVSAKVYIDGSYEGDLMAMSGVKYRIGRESREDYAEALAPLKGDNQLQGYNFRFCATNILENRVSVAAPEGYNREDFLDILPILDKGEITNIFGYPGNCIFKAQTPPLPNNKYDINDVSRGLVRLSMPGHNLDWPEGSIEERKQIFMVHQYHAVGLLYFLQNDEKVPSHYRDLALEWGWCKDEFTETNNLPPQIYVREARRMIGQHVYVQKDSEHAPNDARAVLHTNAIAMGDYGNNCHGTSHEGAQIGGRHFGEFYNPVPPYQIPYGVIVPNEIDNLLVPVAVSSSHVGFCALRLEPIWTSLGQAAGFAAALAIEEGTSVQKIDVTSLQSILHKDKSSTIYVSDVLPGHPDFTAVQWWGTVGGFHNIFPLRENEERGEKIHGQYYKAAPWHMVDMDSMLDNETRKKWLEIIKSLELESSALLSSSTRGAFIQSAFAEYH